MNPRNAMRWMLGELGGLVNAGVLPPESAAALERHYRAKLDAEPEGRLRTLVLAVLGATMLGAGVLLILAHNWEELGRPARTALSLAPVALGLVLALFATLRRGESVAWRESAGVAWAVGVGASIALVSQTYHLEGELADFMRVWMLLILPVPYLLRAVAPALGYLAGIVVWAGARTDGPSADMATFGGFWLFWSAMLPLCAWAAWGAQEARGNRRGQATAWLLCVAAVSAFIGGLLALVGRTGVFSLLWSLLACPLATAAYLVAAGLFPEKRRHPLRLLGAAGIVMLAFLFTFKGMWEIWNLEQAWKNVAAANPMFWGLAAWAGAVALAAALALGGRCWEGRVKTARGYPNRAAGPRSTCWPWRSASSSRWRGGRPARRGSSRRRWSP